VTLDKKKNFGLSAEQFNDLRQKLVSGENEQLFEHVFLAHFKECLEYVVKEDRAPDHLAYDATMDAFLTFRMKIVQGKVDYGNLRYLLTRMARQHYYKRAKKESSVSLDLIHDPGVEPDVSFEPAARELLEKGWKVLGDTCKKLLHAFYYRGQALKDIALATKRKPEALRKQKQRCLATLREAVG